MFVINAPFFFTAVWKIVTAWLDEGTRKKVKIYGSNYESDLFNEIDKANLPKFLNGECACESEECYFSNPGP